MKAWLKKLFIPTAENNYTPHSLQKVAVMGMMVLIIISFTVTNIQSLVWIASDFMVSTILPAVIVKETNEERAADSLSTLRRNSVLDAAAQMKAEHMAKNQYFAHYSPDGVSPWYWFSETGYNFVHAGENLAIHFTDSREVVSAWMNSPTHRANIMNGNYSEIGIGTAEGIYDGFSTVYVVQLFGTPSAVVSGVAGEEFVANVSAAPADRELATTSKAESTTSEESAVVLADAASIEESIEIIPAEPVLVSTSTLVESTEVTNAGVALYSNFISTSTGGVPATIDPLLPSDGTSVPKVLAAMTQPHFVLQIMYGIIGLFVLVSLVLSIFIEIRRQQPLQIAYSFVLLGLMSGLFYLHAVLTNGAVIA